MAELTPMMRQYMEIKEQNPDSILFFRLGDFYEMFFDDALTVSRELDLTLTGKQCGLEERAPMCGVPFHSYEGYVARLISKGYKVAICEQTEDPATAKGLVKRDIIRVVTPGTVLDDTSLEAGRSNFCAAAWLGEGIGGGVLLSMAVRRSRARLVSSRVGAFAWLALCWCWRRWASSSGSSISPPPWAGRGAPKAKSARR